LARPHHYGRRERSGSTLAALEATIRAGCAAHDDWASPAAAPASRRRLHEKAFWDDFYDGKRGTRQADDFEWFVDASDAGRFVLDTIGPEHQRVLHVGAGTSNLGPYLLSERRHHLDVINCDVSETAMTLMSETFPAQDWQVLDLADMDVNPHPWDRSFDLIVDKGALDAVLFGGPELSAKFLFGCARMLRRKIGLQDSSSPAAVKEEGCIGGGGGGGRNGGGMWIQISDDPPERRLGLLRAVLPEAWRVRYQRVRPEVDDEIDATRSLFEQEHWGYVITMGEH
jgi:hypothetical protein